MKLKWWAVALALAGCACAGAERPGPDADDAQDDADDDDLALHEEESRNVHPRAYQQAAAAAAYNALPSGFRPAAAAAGAGGGVASLSELAGYTRPAQLRQQQQNAEREGGPRGNVRGGGPPPPHGGARGEESEEEEREEPDRLAALLQQSRFDCGRRQTGYYADEELACEVFHYCQEGVRHSWICPDGFTFHQVHLICMPPTQENICQQSAKYHFVNEYLYRPVNSEEAARKPNVPLRYSERYYPAEVYHDERRDLDDDEEEDGAGRPRLTASAPARHQVAVAVAAGARPGGEPQVFRSAEEVIIPLGQRRPQPQPQRPYDFRF